MKLRIAVLITITCLVPILCLGAPAAEGQIAIFPGSARDDARGDELAVDRGDVLLMSTRGEPLERLSYTARSYFTSASIEEVTAFYWKELNAAEITDNLQHPSDLALGVSSKVDGQLTGYEPIRDIYRGEHKTQTAVWIKNTLAANRQSNKLKGEYLREVMFIWNAKQSDGKYAVFVIALTDISFDKYYQNYHPQTFISISANIFTPER